MSFSCPDKEPPESKHSGPLCFNKNLLQDITVSQISWDFQPQGQGAKCELNSQWFISTILVLVLYPAYLIIIGFNYVDNLTLIT